MGYLGEYLIDEYVRLAIPAHRFSSGAVCDATSITYRIYEDSNNTEIVSDTAMTKFDAETGFYLDAIQLTAAAGFEQGKHYTALIKGTVDGVPAIAVKTWRIRLTDVNVIKVAGTAQTARDLGGQLDVAVSTRLATASYVAPDNTSITAIKNKTDSLPPVIKKNTALAAFPFKMFNTDGSPGIGLTVTAERSLDRGAFAACANAPSETSSGWYYIDLAASDLNGNTVALKFTAPGAKQTDIGLVTNS